jgi:SH3 domain-containing YSC84-like protein 1
MPFPYFTRTLRPRTHAALIFMASSMLLCTMAKAAQDAVERLDQSALVLDEIMGADDHAIPSELLNKAHCVSIIPGMKKAGFIVGAKYGKGAISCRGESGKGWTAPATIRIEGGSVGLQIGGSATDVVLLVMNESGKNKLISSKFTLGADASAAAGPVGRTASAQTDAQMTAEILSYSRSRGVFAGVSLEGATLRPADDDNKTLYGRDIEMKEILNGRVASPVTAEKLLATLNKYSSQEHK